MKVTYLIYADATTQELVVADQQEWKAIIAHNRGCPQDQRRYFISDIIAEGPGLDCMVIETTKEQHRKWNSARKAAYRNRQAMKKIKFLSLDATFEVETEETSLLAFLPCDNDAYDKVQSDLAMEELRAALREWQPWAEEMLDLYLQGKKHKCASTLAPKYGLTMRSIQLYMKKFEEYTKNFFL